MQNLLVQVSNRYLCLTACEPVGGVDDIKNSNNNSKNASTDKRAYSFSSPYIVPLDRDVLKDKETVWEDPVLFARVVADGLTQMGHGEVKNVYLVLDNFDLTTQEYQHGVGNKKTLDNMAIEKIRDFVGDRVADYSVISKDYATIKNKNDGEEVTAKAFAIPKPLIDDLSAAFKSYSLELIKVVPTEIAMLFAAHKTVYSYNRTIALISMDYCAVRVMIIKGGETLYCHDFRSPVIDMLQVIEEDRGIDTPSAIDYLRTVGYGFKDDCRSAQSQRKIEEIVENSVDDIIHNIRLVVMSLDIAIDQMLLSDFLAYIPHIRNYFLSFGLCKDIQFISDTFNNQSIMPEPSIRARDDFYKAGSFFLFNELMNSGDVFADNLIYGLKASVAKSVDAGKKAAKIFCFALGGLIAAGFAMYGFFEIRAMMDKSNFEDSKWDVSKQLIKQTETLQASLADQEFDMEALPRTQFYTDDVINKLDKQVVNAVDTFDIYNIEHSVDEVTGKEVFNIPISGKIDNYNALVKLQNSVNSHNFFVMNPTLSFSSDEESSKFVFSTSVIAVQPDEDAADSDADASSDSDKK